MPKTYVNSQNGKVQTKKQIKSAYGLTAKGSWKAFKQGRPELVKILPRTGMSAWNHAMQYPLRHRVPTPPAPLPPVVSAGSGKRNERPHGEDGAEGELEIPWSEYQLHFTDAGSDYDENRNPYEYHVRERDGSVTTYKWRMDTRYPDSHWYDWFNPFKAATRFTGANSNIPTAHFKFWKSVDSTNAFPAPESAAPQFAGHGIYTPDPVRAVAPAHAPIRVLEAYEPLPHPGGGAAPAGLGDPVRPPAIAGGGRGPWLSKLGISRPRRSRGTRQKSLQYWQLYPRERYIIKHTFLGGWPAFKRFGYTNQIAYLKRYRFDKRG
jgi:hypothetical protein